MKKEITVFSKEEAAFLLASIECALKNGSYNATVTDEEVSSYLSQKKLLRMPMSYLMGKLKKHEQRSRELGQNNA